MAAAEEGLGSGSAERAPIGSILCEEDIQPFTWICSLSSNLGTIPTSKGFLHMPERDVPPWNGGNILAARSSQPPALPGRPHMITGGSSDEDEDPALP